MMDRKTFLQNAGLMFGSGLMIPAIFQYDPLSLNRNTDVAAKNSYIVRNIFHLKFGHYREVKRILDEYVEKQFLTSPERVLTDFTGGSYRLILETSFANLAAYEKHVQEELADPAWQEWYARFKLHIRSFHREILKQVL